MIHPPTLAYKGLTVVLEKPSRFDNKRLISGNAGEWWSGIIQPLTRFNLDIRTPEENFELLPNTKVILALGQGALDKFIPGKSLLTYRGSPLNFNDITIIPSITVQDSFDRKNYENPEDEEGDDDSDDKVAEKDFSKTRRKNFRFWLYHDTKKAIRLCQFGPRNYPKIQVNYCSQADEIVGFLKSKKGGFLTVDIETDAAQNITCFSVLWAPEERLDFVNPPICYVIPFKRYNQTLLYSQLEYAKIFTGLAVAFRDNCVVGHNLSFDLFVLLSKYHIPPPRKIIDTMICHHRLHPEPEKSLGHCVSLYTDLPYHKDEGVFDPKTYEQEQSLWQYNAKDVITTWFIWCGLKVELMAAKGAMDSAMQGCGLIRPCLTMSYEGMPCNLDKFKSLVEDGDRRVVQFKRVLSAMTKRDFNPNSSKQVCKYLYDDLELKRPLKDPTNEKQLLKIYAKNPLPSIRLILYTRGVKKGASALRKVRLWRGNRITTLYKITGTTSFRLASTALLSFKKSRGFGTNVQNFSKATRIVIEAPKGYLLGQVDQAGAEALAVAYLCKDGRFRSLFTNKIKPHVFVAMHIAPKIWADKLGLQDIDNFLNSPIDNLKKINYWKDLETLIKDSDNESDPKKRYYYIAKTCCHLLNYDAGPSQFQISSLVKSEGSLAFTDEQAKYYHRLYREKLFPEIMYFHIEVRHQLETQNRILYNFFGYPRKFNGHWDNDLFKEAYAFIPQSTIGVLTEIAQTELFTRMEQGDELFKDVSILQNCHDSLLFQAPEDKVKIVGEEISKHMKRHLVNHRGEKFQMGVGFSIGQNWSGYHPEKNPQGMREL